MEAFYCLCHTAIYQLTGTFPKEELYGLTNQMRRAAISIPSNIAEGATRRSNKEYVQFLYIALGSATEIETQLIIAHNLEYTSQQDLEKLLEERNEIGMMIMGLIKYRKGLGGERSRDSSMWTPSS